MSVETRCKELNEGPKSLDAVATKAGEYAGPYHGENLIHSLKLLIHGHRRPLYDPTPATSDLSCSRFVIRLTKATSPADGWFSISQPCKRANSNALMRAPSSGSPGGKSRS